MKSSKLHLVAFAPLSTLYFDVYCGGKLSEKNPKPISLTRVSTRSQAGRLLGIDWGTKHIGLAVSDETGFSIRPLPHIKRTSWKKTVKLIADMCKDYRIRAIVIGLPLRMDGTEGTAAQGIREVTRKLTLTLNLQVFLQDERLTSLEAEEFLRTNGYRSSMDHEHVDSHSAAIILQDFLLHTAQHSTKSTLNSESGGAKLA